MEQLAELIHAIPHRIQAVARKLAGEDVTRRREQMGRGRERDGGGGNERGDRST
jgi:hypothetical protein